MWDTIHSHVVVDVHTTTGILYRRMVCRMHICILLLAPTTRGLCPLDTHLEGDVVMHNNIMERMI